MSRADTTRVLICEDSPSYSQALRAFLEQGDELRVVGTCASGEELLAAIPRLRPDLVTMDLELPGMDGLQATERIMRAHPLPVVVVSGHTGRGSERAAASLAAGALEAIPKSELRLDAAASPTAGVLRRRLRRVATAGALNPNGRSAPVGPRIPPALHPRSATAIGVAASTGGPGVLHTILGALPASYPLPVLVVQHMASGFIAGLARWLDNAVAVPVRLAAEGDVAGPGVWLAPDDAHLELRSDMTLGLDHVREAGRHRPAADVLLESVAAETAAGAVAVVLTGMGRDGAEGTRLVRAAGGLTIAQDDGSAALNGMPRAAADAGAELVLPPEEIAGAMCVMRPRARN